jgi:glutaminyl-peptide cyclotransferase
VPTNQIYMLKKSLLLLGALGLCALLMVQCRNKKTETETTDNEPVTEVKVPLFDRDSAFNFVAKQTEFGPRVPNTAPHKACRDWLIERLKGYGMEVIPQDFSAKAFTGVTLNGTNIIAQYKPELKRRLIFAAHWDSRPFADSPLNKGDKKAPVMGADDGASGVGVLLEVARQLQANPLDLGVDIVLFDLEDYGANTEDPDDSQVNSWCLGSQHWSRNLHYKDGIRPDYGVLLDMVGAPNARFGYDQASYAFAPDVLQKVWDLAAEMGYGQYFKKEDSGGITDDHVYVNQLAKIKMIDIINRPTTNEIGFVDHWHTDGDTIDKIDRFTLRAVGQVLLALIYREHNGTL